ncbi:hypothetical protein K7W42_16650 [Deinococcus sp. HMF7604]|uniref:hypothetical protein n=1 Tax=Deinococcus betulae TaxID=2873312 RepID=UPI001CCBBE82|nr:hypothetical protein [Deinococcus betulae]
MTRRAATGQQATLPAPTVADLLRGQGFTVQAEGEWGLSLAFEGEQYFLLPQAGDEVFYHLLRPGLWPLTTDEDHGAALYACDEVNRTAKLVKLHTADGEVWASVEGLYDTPAAFCAALPRWLAALQEGTRAFSATMQGLSSLQAEP